MDDLFLDQRLLSAAHRLGEAMRHHETSLYITGLAASGKTAIAQVVSQLAGIPLVDSGLPFRLAAYLCATVPAVRTDMTLFDRLLTAHSIRVVNGEYRVFSGMEDITAKLRTAEIDADVPRIAAESRMREIILRFLRSTATAPAIVAARGATEPLTSGNMIQIELKTDFDERVRRRAAQTQLPPATVRRSMRERDERDLFGPSLYPCADIVDSTRLTIDETVARVIEEANERIARLHEFVSFRRRHSIGEGGLGNPLLKRAWNSVEENVHAYEQESGVPNNHAKGRYLLHVSRFSVRELFGPTAVGRCEWLAGNFPENVPEATLEPNQDLLLREAKRIVIERRAHLDKFLQATKLPATFFNARPPIAVRRAGSRLLGDDKGAEPTERYELKDASKELGLAIEEHLHYLGNSRTDTTHRLVLVEESTDLPVLYLSFSANSRKYLEPLLWAYGLRMEEVAVAVRGYGSPRCPRNAMGLFLRMACNRVSADYPHLKAILTDINPNWGYTGGSFREAGFLDVGFKYAPTYFFGETYASRRSVDGRPGQKAATAHKLPLVPTLIMLKPLDNSLERTIKSIVNDGLYVIPRTLYDKK